MVTHSLCTCGTGYVEECLRMGLSCTQDLGFFRNPYVGRSFIAPSQENRDIKVFMSDFVVYICTLMHALHVTWADAIIRMLLKIYSNLFA